MCKVKGETLAILKRKKNISQREKQSRKDGSRGYWEMGLGGHRQGDAPQELHMVTASFSHSGRSSSEMSASH